MRVLVGGSIITLDGLWVTEGILCSGMTLGLGKFR